MFEGIFQPIHMLILLGIVLLVFGPKRLPELGKGLGEAIRGFKQGVHETSDPDAAPKKVENKSETQNEK